MNAKEAIMAFSQSEKIKSGIIWTSQMLELIRGNRAVVFVSHQLRNVEQLCDRVIHLNNGIIKASGDTDKIISQYLSEMNIRFAKKNEIGAGRAGSGEIRYSEVEIKSTNNDYSIQFGVPIEIRARFKCFKRCEWVRFRVGIQDLMTGTIITLASYDLEKLESNGEFTCKFTDLKLRPRSYSVYLSATDLFLVFDQWWNAAQFTVHGSRDDSSGFSVGDSDIIYSPTTFTLSLDN